MAQELSPLKYTFEVEVDGHHCQAPSSGLLLS